MQHYQILFISLILFLASCGVKKEVYYARHPEKNRGQHSAKGRDKPKYVYGEKEDIPEEPSSDNKPRYEAGFAPPLDISRRAFVQQAKKYMGIPYKYGGTNPKTGLDCSGFVYNVFMHFGVKPPRASYQYTDKGREVSLKKARIGDIILFTGSNHKSGKVGHMGIIVETEPVIRFIHSASGKGTGVMISEFRGYYSDHFVKVISVLK